MNVNNGWLKNGFVYFLILVAAAALLYNVFAPSEHTDTISIDQVATKVKEGQIKKITVDGDELTITTIKDDQFISRKEQGVGVVKTLKELGVDQKSLQAIDIEIKPPPQWGGWMTILGTFLPLVIFGGLLFFMLRQAQGSNNQAMSFGKSRARVFTGDKPTVTFQDVAGVEEAKEELLEVVEFLKEPEKFVALGARIPKGVLMVGPPGTGKTLMARAVAGEAEVPFFSISGSEFVEMFVGVGASRARDLFEQAKKNAPCIVFVDEIDAVGRQRGAGLGGSHDEREQTLNQILVEMDGFDSETNVIVIAATNRPDILDPALLRPGRFDRRVVLDKPDVRGRLGILEVHSRGKPLGPDVDLEKVARGTPGFTGADIENLVNEAAILAARRNKQVIGFPEFQESIERLIAGPERRSRLISPKERGILAYHEAGHAVVMHHLSLCDPVHKVSIVARGMTLGFTMSLPEEDRYLRRKAKFEDDMAGLLGGRVSEELVFGDVTTGASNDLDRVAAMARMMVTRYGMSEKLGPLTFGKREEMVFLGRDIGEQRNYSGEVAELIDEEVSNLVTRAHQRARDILEKRRDKLERLAQRLIEVETVDRAAFESLMSDEPPLRSPETPVQPLPLPADQKPSGDTDEVLGPDLQLKPMPV